MISFLSIIKITLYCIGIVCHFLKGVSVNEDDLTAPFFVAGEEGEGKEMAGDGEEGESPGSSPRHCR